jgi:hypothetical protein
MPVDLVWDNEERTILRQIYSGHLQLEDYIKAVNELESMAKTVSHTVHSVMDRTQILSTPNVALPAMRYANSHVPPNLGLRVVIKASMFTQFIVDIGRRVAPRLIDKVYFVNTLEEAHALIARYDAANTNP